MNFTKQIGKNIAALMLTIALMLPTVVQFIDSFDGHDHQVCTENNTHFHKYLAKCDIVQFHLASFNYDIAEYPEFLISQIFTTYVVDFPSLQPHSFVVTNTQLRAPPIFS